jgi:hypothetical protein
MNNAQPGVPFDFDPFGGGKLRLEDGTNIAVGTPHGEEITARILPWYVPAQAKAGQNWKANLAKLRSRFDDFIDQHCTTECYVVQTLIPRIGEFPTEPPGGFPDRQLLCRGPGIRKEPARLFGTSQPLEAQFPILNVRGEPFLNPDGKPMPFRLGMMRYITVKAVPEELRILPIPRLTELLGDGKNIIFQLPPHVATKIWRSWQSGFSMRDTNLIWLDMLFELSWQREKGSPLYTERFAWAENSSIALNGQGLFPKLPQFITSAPGEFCPHEHGYPRAFYSKILDVARASIAAIDELLEYDTLQPQNQPPEPPENHMKEAKSSVFISYSHKDKRYLEDLLTHLKPIERSGELTSWSDKQIEPGSKWFDEIQTALEQAKVAVLLVSANFLASNFIHEHELTAILKRAEANGVRILWIPVRACAYKDTLIAKYQAIIPPDKPLAEMKANRDKAWVKICEEIQKAAVNPS